MSGSPQPGDARKADGDFVVIIVSLIFVERHRDTRSAG